MSSHSLLFQQEPRWRKNRQGTRQQLPEAVQSWAYESGSLTARLRSCYGRQVAVNVLLQRWCTPFLSERKLLAQPEHRHALIREVLLYAGEKPLIVARTVIPRRTINATRSNLSRLGSRPLGEVLFADPRLERAEMDVAWVQPCSWRNASIGMAKIDQGIWGRRTVYTLGENEMLVAEFFLPEVLRAC